MHTNKFSTCFLLLILTSLSGFQNLKLSDYCNTRFAFCVQYPDSFTAQGESENGDGQVFLSADHQTEIRAYGELAIDDFTENLADVYAVMAKDLSVSYHVIKTDWFVLSGLNKDGKIVYLKTARKKIAYMRSEQPDTFVYQTVMITYPKSQQSVYQSYCGVVAKSFGN